MKLHVLKGSTNVRLMIFIADSSSTTGAGLTGLNSASSGLKWHYWRADTGNSGGISITPASSTRGTWTSGGIVEIDATNLPGWYEIGIPNAAFATGSNSVILHLTGATNMVPLPLEVQLIACDLNNATSLGITNLDATISSRLASSGYTAPATPPTVAQIRTELDNNSTRLAHLDSDVSSRLAASVYTAPPTSSAIREEMDAHSSKLDVAVSTRLAASGYSNPTIPPTIVEIREELDAHSTRLAHLDADITSRLSAADYEPADNSAINAIRERTDHLPDTPAAVGSPMNLSDAAITEEKISLPSIGAGPAEGFLGRMDQLWRYFFRKATLSGGILRTYHDDGSTILTSQIVTDNGQTQTRGAAT